MGEGVIELFNEDADARASFSYFVYCEVVTCTKGSQKLGLKVEISSKNGLELIHGGGFIFFSLAYEVIKSH